MVECIQEAGEVIYVPQNWWHAVLNVSPWTCAVTHNLVPAAALPSAFEIMAERDPLFARRWLRCIRSFAPGSCEDREAALDMLHKHCPRAVEKAMAAEMPDDSTAGGAWAGVADLHD